MKEQIKTIKPNTIELEWGYIIAGFLGAVGAFGGWLYLIERV